MEEKKQDGLLQNEIKEKQNAGKSETGTGSGTEKSRKKTGKKKHLLLAGIVLIIVLLMVVIGILVFKSRNKTEVSYRETTVQKGELSVGITQSGEISIGSTTQSFTLDLSAYTNSSSGSSNNFSGNFFDMMGGGSSSSSDSRTLEVEQVYITEGQQISAGDAIASLKESSVSSIRNELTEDVSAAQLTWQQAQTSQKTSDLKANQNYNTWSLYGDYAQADYEATIADLEEAVNTAQTSLDDEEENLADLKNQLTEAQGKKTTYEELVKNAEYQVENTSREEALYYYITAENGREEAQKLLDDIEDEIESLEDQIETSEENIQTYTITLHTAMKAMETGTAKAQTEYQTRTIYYNSAASYRDTSLAQNSLTTEKAKGDYEDAQEKLQKFDEAIQNNQLVSGYSGVVSSVSVSAGETLQTGTALMTVNDYDEVTVSVSVSEDDLDAVQVGGEANVSISAYPDETYTGTVSSIGDSTYNSSTGETDYTVKVKISGNVQSLYSGMSADVTFVTGEKENVLYVPNRAILRENGKSYVQVYDENGKVTKKEVTTGFSDGTNAEIKEGLAEGDVVLIER